MEYLITKGWLDCMTDKYIKLHCALQKNIKFIGKMKTWKIWIIVFSRGYTVDACVWCDGYQCRKLNLAGWFKNLSMLLLPPGSNVLRKGINSSFQPRPWFNNKVDCVGTSWEGRSWIQNQWEMQSFQAKPQIMKKEIEESSSIISWKKKHSNIFLKKSRQITDNKTKESVKEHDQLCLEGRWQ